MLDTSTRIAPMQILLDRGLSQAGVLDRGLSHATWASYWSHGAFWTRQRLMTRDFASLHQAPRTDAERKAAVDRALARISTMFWGPRVPVDEACGTIREWIRGNLS